MSPEDDALRDMAANRGCKLVRSRRRKPGGDYGRYGLKDAKTGREILGFAPGGLTATREEVEAFLRGGLTASWKRSLMAAVPDAPAPERSKRRARAEQSPPPRREARARPEPPPPKPAEARKAKKPKKAKKAKPPAPAVREARPKDSPAIAALIAELGYEAEEAEVRRRLKRLGKAGEAPLVVELDGIVGCLAWHVTPVLHRPDPVGRITMMTIAEAARGKGIGALLLTAAEAKLRERGCGLAEVTSNMKRMRAHGFYQRAGYERTGYRFVKPLK